MTLLDEIQHRLKKAGVRPNTLRGQHFLADTDALLAVAEAAKIRQGEIVLEIGPGVGNLTDEILKKGADVIAVEKDPHLAHFLREHYGERVDVRAQDILSFDETTLPERYVVVGNIPYYITGKIVRKFLESTRPPKRIVLTVQKEVGERIAAPAPHATFVSVLTHLMADVQLGRVIPPHHFWPVPKVSSIILVLTPHTTQDEMDKELVRFVRLGFAQPRKTLVNNLAQVETYKKELVIAMLQKIGKNKKTRAHVLLLDEWQQLYRILKRD